MKHMCSACGAPEPHFYDSAVVGLPGVWMCDSCADPALVADRISREIAEKRRIAKAVDQSMCPFSGEPLTDHGGGNPGTLSCWVCDCFGFKRCFGCGEAVENGKPHGLSNEYGQGCV